MTRRRRTRRLPANQQMRTSIVRQFARYMCRLGHRADVPDKLCGVKSGHSVTFSPRILSHAEMERILATVDQIRPDAKASPWRHLVMPEVFPQVTLHGLRRSFGTLCERVEMPSGVSAQIMGHRPSAPAEKHYRRPPLDLLRKWHDAIEAWILQEAGVATTSSEISRT